MGGTSEKIDQKPEIVETNTQTKTQESTVEDMLKQRLPDSPEKQAFFLTLFKDKQINDIFTQGDITKYMQQKNLSRFWNTLKTKTLEERTKLLVEDMDIYFKENWWIKEIKVYEEKDKEKSKEDKEKSKEDKEKSEEDKEKSEEDKESTETQIETKDTLLESRKKTKESYDTLDKSKYPEPTDEEIKEQKANIRPQTQSQLESKWLKIEDYTKFLITEKKHEKQLRKEENTEFLDNLKELKQWLGDTTTMAETTDRKHTDLIVGNNLSLTAYTKESPTLNKLTIPQAPEFKDFEKEFGLYVKFIPNEEIRENIQKNKDIIKNYKEIHDKDEEDARDSEGEKACDEYTKAINNIKEKLPDKTKAIAKQRVLWSCITGLARYFDTTNIDPTGAGTQKENFADDFIINTQDGFHIQKGTEQNEKNDDVLYIKGNIKGNEIWFYYNLTNPDAQIQSDDFLHFDTEAETFTFGVKWWGQNNLGIKLPTITTLSNEAQMIIDKDFSTELNNAKDMDEFERSFKNKISNQLLKNYGQEALVKTRVERDIEKNITTQTLQNMFFPDVIRTELNKDNMIDKTTEKKPRNIMEIWDKSTENMRSDELRIFRWLLNRLDPLITKENHPNLEPKWQKLLGEIQKERTAVNYSQDRGKNILIFFKKFSKDNKIQLQDMKIFINSLEKEEDMWENIHKFSPEFQTAYEKDDADSLLENIV